MRILAQSLALLFLLTPQYALARTTLNTAWNPKIKAYKRTVKSYKKAEQKRAQEDRTRYSVVKSNFNKKEAELKEKEKQELKTMKEELYKDFKMPTINPARAEKSKNEHIKATVSLADLRYIELEKKKLIGFKYKRLALKLKEERNIALEKVAVTNYQNWKALYNQYRIEQYPQPDPEIEDVPLGKGAKIKRFKKK